MTCLISPPHPTIPLPPPPTPSRIAKGVFGTGVEARDKTKSLVPCTRKTGVFIDKCEKLEDAMGMFFGAWDCETKGDCDMSYQVLGNICMA